MKLEGTPEEIIEFYQRMKIECRQFVTVVPPKIDKKEAITDTKDRMVKDPSPEPTASKPKINPVEDVEKEELQEQPKTNRLGWTPEQDAMLLRLAEKYQDRGRWAKIAAALGKNYHTVLMHHKLLTKQQKPKKKPFHHRNGALDK